ncbi:MAG TPA: response regulator [Thermoanaerobaculia bacterium]|nr:response regulator [Thermoanaerobaculia bacterium]
MRRRVLVVDDDSSVRVLIRGALEQAGYEVTVVRNGFDAIARLAADDYDVVLLDIGLPKVRGVDVVGRLDHAVLAHTVLLTTGEAAQLADLPVSGVISKPVDLRTLLAETKECIGH